MARLPVSSFAAVLRHADFHEAVPLSAGQVDRVLDDPESWLPGIATAGSVKISLILGGPERKQLSGPG